MKLALLCATLALVAVPALAPPVAPAAQPPIHLIVVQESGVVSMPLGAPGDYLGREELEGETLFRTRLPDGSVQTYHARGPVLRAYVGDAQDEEREAATHAARRADA